MKKILVIWMLVCTIVPVRAQWYSVNIDIKTAEAMTEALGVQWGTEEYSRDLMDEILKNYKHADEGSIVIFGSKWLDRKAMVSEGLFGNAAENYYYRRIYNMVSARIMPKIWSVATLMIKRPDLALYWGPYLYKTTEDVKALCMQFECVVTNGHLTFKDIAFLAISDKLKMIFDYARLGDVDWRQLFENFSDFGKGLTKDALVSDLKDLLDAGKTIATAGGSILQANASRVGHIFQSKPGEVLDMFKDFRSLYESISSPGDVMNLIMEEIGSTDSTGVMNLFQPGSYNVTDYMSNYLNELLGRYYKQRWYIYWQANTSKELVCDWTPPSNLNDRGHRTLISDGRGGWYRVYNNDNFYGSHPSADDLEATDAAVGAACGWNREKVNQMNREQSLYQYTIVQKLVTFVITDEGPATSILGPSIAFDDLELDEPFLGTAVDQPSTKTKTVEGWSFSYRTTVYRQMKGSQEVYEEWFDSQTMDEGVMSAHMEAMRQDFVNRDMTENTYTGSDGEQHSADSASRQYYIGKDERMYYSAADTKKLQKAISCSFTLNCSSGVNLGEGNFQFPVNPEHEPLNDKSKRYAMEVILDPNGLDTSGIDERIAALTEYIYDLKGQIADLETEIADLQIAVNNALPEEADALRTQLNSKKADLNTVKKSLTSAEKALKDAREAREEMVEEYTEEIEEDYRIPDVMNEIERNYNIQWDDAGTWAGYTFVRRGTIADLGIAEFSATLSAIRQEKWFLFWRIRRSIIGVQWKLAANYSQSDVIDVMKLDPEDPEEERVKVVNARQKELQSEFPDCIVEINYEYAEPDTKDDTDDPPHLLWLSDRLAIAREVDYRLTKIYSRLVTAETFLSSRETILDYLKARFVPNTDWARHGHHSNEAFKRWIESGKNAVQKDSTNNNP